MRDPDKKAAALSLLRRGLITQAEAADMCGTSRQLVAYWCKTAGILSSERETYLCRLWQKTLGE